MKGTRRGCHNEPWWIYSGFFFERILCEKILYSKSKKFFWHLGSSWEIWPCSKISTTTGIQSNNQNMNIEGVYSVLIGVNNFFQNFPTGNALRLRKKMCTTKKLQLALVDWSFEIFIVVFFGLLNRLIRPRVVPCEHHLRLKPLRRILETIWIFFSQFQRVPGEMSDFKKMRVLRGQWLDERSTNEDVPLFKSNCSLFTFTAVGRYSLRTKAK